jgi:putative PEP-CTERM system histidine kinase
MTASQAVDYIGAFSAGVLALATAFRAGRSIPRWSFVVGLLILGAEAFLEAVTSRASTPDEIARWQTWRLLIVTLFPPVWLAFSTTYSRNVKDGVLRGNRRWLLCTLAIPFIIGVTVRGFLVAGAEPTAWGTHWSVAWTPVGTSLWVFVLVSSVAIVVNLERTFRAAVGTARWRIKYMLLGVGLIFVVRIYTSSQAVLYRGTDSSIESINSIALIVGAALTLRSLFRTGHFDLEVYPSRSILQKSLTVFLAGAYLLIVGVLAKIVALVGGDASFPAKAFVIMAAVVSLAVVMQSDRARVGLRRFVSRNFRRSPHDYRAIWKTFTEGTASRVEQTDLCRGLVRLVADTCDALSVSIYLTDDEKSVLVQAASTITAAPMITLKDNSRNGGSAMLERFKAEGYPEDIEKSTDSWARHLRECHPAQFSSGGHRVCVPLIGRGDFLGVILIGDRVGGAPFSFEDFDMLKCIGDHAAASVLNTQLSTKLLQAKELEAFQAMAAFFVHDLKNAASTLNLMLQNFPAHFDNPEFKEDALRGISKTAEHINRLVRRLGMLRHELKMEPAEEDINDLIKSALAGIERNSSYAFSNSLNEVPKVRIDRDQIHKVVTNLILNAAEASPPNGEVRVSTEHQDGWAVITVKDSGCGMSPNFIANSLFRPFQTTKKNGLGIGMFQSKMIVEAHRGRITVESEEGKGTTFRVFLPATLSS